jgi:hypothetical protein
MENACLIAVAAVAVAAGRTGERLTGVGKSMSRNVYINSKRK